MKLFLRLFVLIFLINPWKLATAQSPDLLWVKKYGGHEIEQINYTIRLSNGDYLISGSTLSDNFGFINHPNEIGTFLMRIDSNGNEIWDLVFSNIVRYNHKNLAEDESGNIYMIGTYSDPDTAISNHQNTEVAVIKCNANGRVQWTSYFGGSGQEIGAQIKIGSPSRLYVSCYSNSSDRDFEGSKGDLDCWLLQLDTSGVLIWTKNIGGQYEEQFCDLLATKEGSVYGYISTMSNEIPSIGLSGDYGRGRKKSCLFKLDSSGNTLWSTYVDSNVVFPSHLRLLENGDLLGVSMISALYGSIGVIKISSDGEKRWYKTYGSHDEIKIRSAIITNEQGFLLIGSDSKCSSSNCAFAIKLDSAGRKTWEISFSGNKSIYFTGGVQNPSGEFLLYGGTNCETGDIIQEFGTYDIFLTKLGIEPFQISAPREACEEDSILFLSNSADSLDWYIDGNLYASGHYFHAPANPGNSAFVVEGCVSKFGISRCDTHYVAIYSKPEFVLPDTFWACIGDSQTLCVKNLQNVNSIQWAPGSKDSCLYVKNPGGYSLQLSNPGCLVTTQTQFQNHPDFSYSYQQLDTPCFEESVARFISDGNPALRYFWDNQSSSSLTYETQKADSFILRVSDPFSCTEDTLIYPEEYCPFYFYVPTAFSPNADGKNELFGPVSEEFTSYEMEIYNRWGILVFQSTNQAWDGNFRNTPALPDIYYVRIRIIPTDLSRHKPQEYKGVFTLIR